MSEMDGFDLYEIERELRALKGQGGRRSLEIKNAEIARAKARRDLEWQKAFVRSGTAGTVQAKEDACWLDQKVQEASSEAELRKVWVLAQEQGVSGRIQAAVNKRKAEVTS